MTDEPVGGQSAAADAPATSREQVVTEPAAPDQAEFTLPDEYKDKSWASKVKSQDDLYKQLDNLNSLVGKKVVIPDHATATPQELETFYSSLRPKEKTDYKFSEDTPDELKATYSDWAYEAGLSPLQLEKLAAKLNETSKAKYESDRSVEGFEGILKESFGDSYKATGAEAHKVLMKNLNETDKAVLDKLPNDVAGMVYRLAANLNKAYGANEGGKASSDNAGNPAEGKEARITELKKKMLELQRNPLAGNEYDKAKEEYFTLIGMKRG